MASTVSTVLRLELQADGENENTWGLIANRNFEVLERAGAGHKDLAIAGATTTLTATANQLGDWHYHSFKCTGTLTANSAVVVPNQSRVYLFENATTGAFTLTVKTASGTGVVIPTGQRAVLTCDATNVTGVVLHPYDATAYLPLGGGTVTNKTSFTLNTSTDDGTAQVTISSNRNGTTNPTTPNLRVQSFAPSIAFRDITSGQENRDVHILRDQNFLSFRYDAAGDGVLTVPFSIDVSTGIAAFTGAIRTPTGTAALPAYSFTGDTNTGLRSGGADIVTIVTNGADRLTIGATGISTFGAQVQAPAGTVGAPAFSFSTDTNSGLRSGGADIVSIVTGGADRMTVDANGHAYLGTGGATVSAADAKVLQIKGPNSGGGYAILSVECGLNAKSGVFQIAGADGDIMVGTQTTNTTGDLQLLAGGATRLTVQADGAVVPTGNILWTATPGALHVGYTALVEHQVGNIGPIHFGINDGGGWVGMMVGNFRNGSFNSQDIYFRTAEGGVSPATTRMQITSSGYLMIGQTATSTPGYGNTITGRAIWPTGRQFVSQTEFSQWNMNSDGSIVTFARSGAAVGSITVNTTSTSYNTSSDYRLKQDVEPLTGALDRLDQLEPKRFRWAATPDAPKVDGFLAHEAQDVVPEAVTGEYNGEDFGGNPEYQQIDQAKLVPLLVAAIKELRAQVAALQNP